MGADCEWGAETGALQDVLIRGSTIEAVGHDLAASDAEIIDATGKLVLPGLVNAHFHSSELFVRGRYDGLNFDTWGLYVYPFLTSTRLPPRLVYLRTAIAALELARNGVTSVTDDVAQDVSGQDLDDLDSVFTAYCDVGLRSNCSGNVMNRSQDETWPFAGEVMDESALAEVRGQPFPSVSQYRDFSEEAVRRFHGWRGLCQYVVAPVAPQWCTRELLIEAAEIADRHDLNLHTHVLETRWQAIASASWDSGGFIPWLRGLGALTERTTLAHGVWLSRSDIDQIAETGASVVHNPVANLRLGVGVAPVREMLDRGVSVALGTDGLALHESPSVIEAMRAAALLSRARSDQPEAWLRPQDVLKAATVAGARSCRLGPNVGVLAPGFKADVVVVDDDPVASSREADARSRVVFGPVNTAGATVIVDGDVIVSRGAAVNVDERALYEELASYGPLVDEMRRGAEARHAHLAPSLDQMHRRAAAVAVDAALSNS